MHSITLIKSVHFWTRALVNSHFHSWWQSYKVRHSNTSISLSTWLTSSACTHNNCACSSCLFVSGSAHWRMQQWHVHNNILSLILRLKHSSVVRFCYCQINDLSATWVAGAWYSTALPATPCSTQMQRPYFYWQGGQKWNVWLKCPCYNSFAPLMKMWGALIENWWISDWQNAITLTDCWNL